jgi:hypothetical protein
MSKVLLRVEPMSREDGEGVAYILVVIHRQRRSDLLFVKVARPAPTKRAGFVVAIQLPAT